MSAVLPQQYVPYVYESVCVSRLLQLQTKQVYIEASSTVCSKNDGKGGAFFMRKQIRPTPLYRCVYIILLWIIKHQLVTNAFTGTRCIQGLFDVVFVLFFVFFSNILRHILVFLVPSHEPSEPHKAFFSDRSRGTHGAESPPNFFFYFVFVCFARRESFTYEWQLIIDFYF